MQCNDRISALINDQDISLETLFGRYLYCYIICYLKKSGSFFKLKPFKWMPISIADWQNYQTSTLEKKIIGSYYLEIARF